MHIKQKIHKDTSSGKTTWHTVDTAVSLFVESQRVLAAIETNGLKIDRARLEQNKKEAADIIADYEQKLAQMDIGQRWQRIVKNPTWSNRNELALVLFTDKVHGLRLQENELALDEVLDMEKKTLYRLTAKYPEIKDFIFLYADYQSMLKLRSTYLVSLEATIDKDDFVHPSFSLLSVVTYRTCLAADTPISMCVYDRGAEIVKKIRIADVKPGDYVYCLDDKLEPTVAKVKNQWKTGRKKIIRLHYVQHSGRQAYLDCTPDHRIRMADGEYCEAQNVLEYKSPEFKPNSPYHRYALSIHLPTLSSKYSKWGRIPDPETSMYEILRVEDLGIEADVYDLEVGDYANFVANELVVHNSCKDPNVQNIPTRNKVIQKLVRTLFVPRAENRHIVEVDFSGIEVCTSASVNHDKTLVKSITEGLDFHRWVASKIYLLDEADVTKDMRQSVKGDFTFAAFYGSYWKQMALALWDTIQIAGLKLKNGTLLCDHLRSKGITCLSNGDRPQPGSYEYLIQTIEREFWDSLFSGYRDWKNYVFREAQQKGYVDTPDGFRVGGVIPRNSATNTPSQCSAAHCLLTALCGIHNDLQTLTNADGSKMFPGTLLINEIHDSIVADVPEAELEQFLQLCHYWMTVRVPLLHPWLTVPMTVEADVAPLGKSWAEKEAYKINLDYDKRMFSKV